MTITDAMVDKALSAWFSVKPSSAESDAVLEKSMRAALEAAISQGACDQDELTYMLDAILGNAKIRLCIKPSGEPDGLDTLLSERHRFLLCRLLRNALTEH